MVTPELIIQIISMMVQFCNESYHSVIGELVEHSEWLKLDNFPQLEFKLSKKTESKMLLVRRDGQEKEYPHITFLFMQPPFYFKMDEWRFGDCHYSYRKYEKIPFSLYAEGDFEYIAKNGIANIEPLDAKAFLESFARNSMVLSR
ncbi:MAG: hypothetical protein HC932_00630 [Thermales bacterium]|nr:hypothetical protein [Thermales bacterium]